MPLIFFVVASYSRSWLCRCYFRLLLFLLVVYALKMFGLAPEIEHWCRLVRAMAAARAARHRRSWQAYCKQIRQLCSKKPTQGSGLPSITVTTDKCINTTRYRRPRGAGAARRTSSWERREGGPASSSSEEGLAGAAEGHGGGGDQ